MRLALPLALILLGWPGRAAVADENVSVLLQYEAFSHGLAVMRMAAELRLSSSGYGISVAYHTVGLAGLFYNGHENDVASGRWDEAGPEPRQYLAQGTWRGHQRETELLYHGVVPDLTIAHPPIATEREPVPVNLLPGTIDTLSSLVRLMRHVETSNSCELTARTYDGRRLSRIVATTAGTQVLDPRGQSTFSGPALRCDFTGQMLAGFPLDHPAGAPMRPYHGSAWLARILPSGPPLPVRMSFQTKWVGEVNMYLTGVTNEATAVARANPGRSQQPIRE